MENVTGFAVEAEETQDVAAPGAIDVTEKGIVKFEDTVKNAIPAIPSVLTINGLEVDNVKLKATIENEVKTMKINGLGDKEGFDKAEAKLKELSKLRTGSNTWRTNVMKPVIAFQKGLKKVIDETGELCSEGEKYLEEILEPVRRAVELARIAEEERKDALAETRAAQIVEMGGVFDGKGSYNFPHEPAIFILASSLRALADEDYEKELVDIKAAWDTEVARLQAIEDEKNAEQIKLQTQLQDLNAERTEFRKEQLEMKGFKPADEGGYFSNSTGLDITESDILNLNAAEWKALLNPTPVAPVAEENIDLAQEQEFNDGVAPGTYTEPKIAPVQTYYAPPAPFAQMEPETASEVPVESVIEQVSQSDLTFPETISVPLQFDRNDSPFMTLEISKKIVIHIYPEEFSKESTEGLQVGFTGDFGGNLKYSIIQKPQ